MKKPRGAPKKPTETKKLATKQIRLNATELAAFQAAADLAGIPLSGWMRERLRMVARKELEAANQPVPFLRPSN